MTNPPATDAWPAAARAAAVALSAMCLLLAGCAPLQGKAGPGNQSTYDNGVLGNGRSIEENRKVGSPGSD